MSAGNAQTTAGAAFICSIGAAPAIHGLLWLGYQKQGHTSTTLLFRLND